MLSIKNKHERDERISFEEKTHTYYIDGSSEGIVSVTTLIHQHFPKFDASLILKKMKDKNQKYPNMTDKEIKELWYNNGRNASQDGTKLHKLIENFYNGIKNPDEDLKEYRHFIRFHNDVIKDKYDPYRTEWSVFDGELELAGQIDMVYKKDDGTYAIYDWKRIKDLKKENRFETGLGRLNNLSHCNYTHYSIQLNIYKRLLETRYSMIITEMFLVILHPDNDNYILEKVQDMSNYIDIIFEERYNRT